MTDALPDGSAPEEPTSVYQTPGATHYLIVCAAALAVMLMVGVLEQGMSCWTVVPILIGLLGLVTRWSAAPMLLVLTLAGFELVMVPLRDFAFGRIGREPSAFSVLLMCTAAVTYVTGHYRLQGIIGQLVPADPRRPGGRLPRTARDVPGLRPEEAMVQQRRSHRLVTSQEVLVLVATLPVWAVLAEVLWLVLSARVNDMQLPSPGWRLIVVIWLFGLGALVVSSVLHFLGRQGMTRAESLLELQDVLWQETRGEQRSINRWLAWARLARPRRKDKP
jgi:hypothetical protein